MLDRRRYRQQCGSQPVVHRRAQQPALLDQGGLGRGVNLARKLIQGTASGINARLVVDAVLKIVPGRQVVDGLADLDLVRRAANAARCVGLNDRQVGVRGILSLALSLDHAGPMAWTVEDRAMLLQEMAAHDPMDPASVDHPALDFSSGLGRDAKGIRIGVAPHWHTVDCPVSPAVQASFDAALTVWKDQGAEIVDLTMPSLFDYQAVCVVIMICEAYALHEPWMRSQFNDYGELSGIAFCSAD